MKETSALARWQSLDGERRAFLTRCEQYARFTIPKLCPPDGYNQASQELTHDWQALGAQGVNHLANKLMLTLFAPSRPFVRFELKTEMVAELVQMGMTEQVLAELLATGERKAVAALDQKACRPKIFEILKHLLVTGNGLLCLEEDMRVMGIKHYAVQRSMSGKVLEILTHEQLKWEELDDDIRPLITDKSHGNDVVLLKWIEFKDDQYHMTQHVDNVCLPENFNGKWDEEALPYRALTWDLSDDANYGTGYVEDYAGDFVALSALSQAQVEGGILAAEFRWLANPGGLTAPEDIARSANGAVIPGARGDLDLVNSGTAVAISQLEGIVSKYERRIGKAFLLGSAVTRDAERVTAEEYRGQALELETSLGGAYSRIAIDFQRPVAYWLLKELDFQIKGTAITPTIITGLDALSRNGDLDNLKMWLGDMAQISNLPPPLLQRLKVSELAAVMAAARGVESGKFLFSEAEFTQIQQQAQQQLQEQPPGAPPTEEVPQ